MKCLLPDFNLHSLERAVRSPKSLIGTLFPVLLLLFVALAPVAGQEAASVRIEPFQAEGGTEVGGQLAETVEQTIRLSLRLIEGVTVLSPGEGQQETVAISGVVRVGGGEYLIDLALRDRRIPGEVQELSVSTESLLEIFDLADQLTEEALRQITRRDIAFGSLVLLPRGEGSWQVVLGGERFEDSPRSFNRLPAGTHTISIEQLQGGEPEVLLEQEITVDSGATTQVAFELPDPNLISRRIISRSESEYISSYLYGLATPVSSVLNRASAAAEEVELSELYAPRLAAWDPGAPRSGSATDDRESRASVPETTSRLDQGRFLLNAIFQGDVETAPAPVDLIADALNVFDTQLAAWAEELTAP